MLSRVARRPSAAFRGPLMTPLERYLSDLTITQGRAAGQSFKVLPWQGRFLRGAFAAGASTSALSVARGNGKTALLSAVACATLDGPLSVTPGTTPCGSRRVLFAILCAVLRRRQHLPLLRARMTMHLESQTADFKGTAARRTPRRPTRDVDRGAL